MTQYLEVHFSSLRGDWRTPRDLYGELDQEFHFTMDPCPPDFQIDGLEIPWTGRVYVNPPYGRELIKWIRKAKQELPNCQVIVMLLPSRTDTKWFHNYLLDAEIRFIKGRLHFDESKNSAPFPSMIAVLRHGSWKRALKKLTRRRDQ